MNDFTTMKTSEFTALKAKVAALEAENAELRELAEKMLEYVVLIGGTFPARLAVKAKGIFAKHDAKRGRDGGKLD